MGYTYDDSIVLPTNFVGVDPSPLNTGLGPTNTNLTNNCVADLKASIRGGKYHGALDQSAGMPAVGPAGSVLWTAKAGRLFASQNGTAFEGLGRTVNEKEWTYFGIKADGVTDDTAAFQAALAYFGPGGTYGLGGVTGRLILPPASVMILSAECTYWGSVSRSLNITSPSLGTGTGALNGCVLRWAAGGPTGQVMLRMVGATGCCIDNIQFDGNVACHDLLAWDNATVNGGVVMWGPSSTNWTERCTFINGVSGGNGMRLGGVTNTQVSEQYTNRCMFLLRQGQADYVGNNVLITSTANCKDFWFDSCEFGNANIHINATANNSSCLAISNSEFGIAGSAMVTGGGQVTMHSCTTEGDAAGVHNYLLYDGGPPAGGAVGNTLSMEDCFMAGSYPAVGVAFPMGGGVTTVVDTMIRQSGQLKLKNNVFANVKPSPTTGKIVTGFNKNYLNSGLTGAGGSLGSEGNYYQYCSTGFLPAYDSGGNLLTGPGAGAGNTVTGQVYSLNDNGSDSTGATPIAMEPFFLRPPTSSIFLPIATGTPTKLTYSGQNRVVSARVDYTFADFQTAALTKDISPISLNLGIYLLKVRAEVTTAFAGTAGTITLSAGVSSAGDTKIWGAKDVKTAAISIGDASADYTTAPGMGDNLALGYCNATMKAALYQVWIRMTSGTGNLSGLTAGVVTLYFDYRVP